MVPTKGVLVQLPLAGSCNPDPKRPNLGMRSDTGEDSAVCVVQPADGSALVSDSRDGAALVMYCAQNRNGPGMRLDTVKAQQTAAK
jgi:hypothetical protein